MHLDLSKFHVSPNIGFLLESPLEHLPAYYESWESTAKSMLQLVEENGVRNRIDQLPILDIDRLHGHREFRLAHLQLCTLISGYVWSEGDDNVPRILPRNLSVPFYEVSQKLGMALGIGYHVTTVLNNYKLKNPRMPLHCDNMEIIYFKLVEDTCNDWFLLATAQVELEFAAAVMPLRNAIMASCQKDLQSLQRNLRQLQFVIENMESSLCRMNTHLKPDAFFNQFRPYLAGTKGGKYDDWGGIILEGVSDRPVKLSGGSAAQAAPIQCLDALLQIEHESKMKQFLSEMRQYMLPDHRRFIEKIEKTSRVRRVVMERALDVPDLKQSFDDCVQALVNFRNRHIQIVTRFIIVPRSGRQIDLLDRTYETLDEIGTGGTGIMPFLKSIRDTTKQSRLE